MKLNFALATTALLSTLSSVVTAVPTAEPHNGVIHSAELTPRDHRRGEFHVVPSMIIRIAESVKDHFDVSKYGSVAGYGRPHEVRTLLSFDIPATAKDKKCRLYFKNPDWYHGSGNLKVYELKEGFNDAATWYYGRGRLGHHYVTFKAKYGPDFSDGTWAKGFGFFDCPAGKTVYYEVQSTSKGDVVNWHQEQNAHDTPGFTMAVTEPAYAF